MTISESVTHVPGELNFGHGYLYISKNWDLVSIILLPIPIHVGLFPTPPSNSVTPAGRPMTQLNSDTVHTWRQQKIPQGKGVAVLHPSNTHISGANHKPCASDRAATGPRFQRRLPEFH